MSDQNRRLSIDLDEIERQLRQSAERHASLQGAARPQASPGGPPAQQKSDPLAELARIVGQDDPFDALLSGDARARREPPAAPAVGRAPASDPYADRYADPYAPAAADRHPQQDPYAQDPYAQDPHAQDPNAPHDPYAYSHAHDPHAQPGFAEDPRAAYAAHGFAVDRDQRAAYPADYDPREDAYHDDPRYAADWAGAPPRDAYYEDEAPPPRRARTGRKSLVTAVALVGVAVVGVGSALMFTGSVEQSGEPPLIAADPSPVRISPENPGGVEIPNQNKAIYGQDSGETRIVDREEQPVDVAELARQSPRVVLPAPGGVADDPIARAMGEEGLGEPGLEPALVPSPAVAALGEPRRVRTVTVRPDGSVVGAEPIAPARPTPAMALAEPAAAEPTLAPVATLPSLGALDPNGAEPRSIADLVPLVTGQGGAVAAPEAPTQTASASVDTGAATAAPAFSTPIPPPAPPRSASAPAPTPAPATESGPLQLSALPSPAAPAPAPAAAAAPSGGYAVQLAIRGSEDRAREAFQQLQARYNGIIGDGQPIIRQAVVNGQTIFRVRVGPYPLDRANQACDRIKAEGGDCFVAPNS